jgi:subtilisin-like proprotein convertase family protein
MVKRIIPLTFIVMLIVVLGLLFLPTGLAERASNSKNTKSRLRTPSRDDSRRETVNPQPKTRSTPLTGQAVAFGRSRPVSELAAEQFSLKDTSRVLIRDHEEIIEEAREKNARGKQSRKNGVRVEEDGVREKNRRNAERVHQIDPNAKGTPDTALARVPSSKGITPRPEVMPTPGVNFETISLTDTTALPGQGFLPPDTVGEIGPNHFVQMVNSAFRVYDRTGTPLMALTSIGTLFGTIPGPCAGNEDGDPIVLYDQLADRWLLSEFCTVANPNTHQLIAISQTGDPTGAYYLYDFMMPNNKFNDYPKFGVWSDAYYMTDNQFNQAGTQFLGAGVFAFDRDKMIAGDPTASFIYFDLATGCPGGCEFGGLLPADLDGFTPPPAGAPAPMIQFDADEFGATDSLRILDFHADFATPANSTLTERTGSPLAVAAFDPREVPSGSRNVVPQPSPAPKVDVISDRLMFRLPYRNFGTHESLVMNHSVNADINPLFRSGVRYYEIRKTSPGAAWTVHEQATMAGDVGDTLHRWMGSTALNGAGSQAVGYSVSSATVFPSIRYAGRLSTDPPGSLAQGEATLIDGTSSQTHSSGRWGDYSDMTVDPVDDCTFWYTQEYVTGASAPDSTRWHTRVGAFQFGSCVPIPKGILTGTVTSSVTGALIQGALVVASPFIRLSNSSGVYNVDPIGTGTYALTVSAPGYATATIPNVSIALGATTTQNVQLVPISILSGGNVGVTTESCAPSNNAIDPGETVTVNLPIANIGGSGASTSNLVATLQATGGVTNPSGPQNYGAVAEAAGAVSRPFTFTVGVPCGQIVVMTLQLQDGANDLGTITFTRRAGTLGPSSTSTYTSGNLTTPIPDDSFVDIPIAVPDFGSVADVNVRLRLNHTWDEDLRITLIAPDNTSVLLSANRDTAAGGGDNYGTGTNDCAGTPTVFDDSAAQPISAGLPPFAGTFRPESPLSALNGLGINGTWKLRIADEAAQDLGTVGCVTLEITRQPFVCCGVIGTPLINSAAGPTIAFEAYSPANNAPDPGEGITVNFPLINIGDGNTTNLVATLQNSGGITPVAPVDQTYGALAAGGPAVSRSFSFVANGSCGSNVTATLQLQDGAINFGTVTFTFRLGTVSSATQTFSNATPIVIPGTGTGGSSGSPAAPYPSTIAVAGIIHPITKVTVTLKGITHTFPADIDVLLVGPTGVKFILMSDVIGGTDWTGQTYTIDDSAAALFPSSGAPPASGTFKPTNINTTDAFPAPAPAGPYLNPATAGTDTLAAFNGQNPNGTWSLYVVDDGSSDVGTFAGGWDLTLTSSQNICFGPSAAPGTISGTITNPDGAAVPGVTIKLTGATSATTISDAAGNYHFDSIETDSFYTVTPSAANHQFSPENRSFSLLGNMTNAVFTATPDAIATTNAIDSHEYFVRQHYLDFLGREPDQGGFNYWTDQLNSCSTDGQCIRNRRVEISAAFFIEQEFQRTGSFIFQFYRGALGRTLTYSEFAMDRQRVVDGPDLETNKQAFAEAFVDRTEFVQKYQANTTAESFVDAILHTVQGASGTDLSSERSRLIDKYNSAATPGKGRSLVVRDLAENGDFAQATYNQAFVLMEYFGYLRRDPDQGGYDFWLNVLNNREAGNYRGMVCAFITSAEYQRRFSPVVTRTNADCGQ